jgi:uncharacterized membrane protein (UPF0127 family)
VARLTATLVALLIAGCAGCQQRSPSSIALANGQPLRVDVVRQLPPELRVDLGNLRRFSSDSGRWIADNADRPWHITSASFPIDVVFLDSELRVLAHSPLASESESMPARLRNVARAPAASRHVLITRAGWLDSVGLQPGAQLEINSTLASQLPQSTTLTLDVAGHTVHAEVALDDASRARGLMWRPTLADDRGMLFIEQRTRSTRFWMKNCSLPLSIAFIRDDGTIANIHEMQAETQHRSSDSDYPRYPSTGPVRYALEMRAGWFAERGISAGARVTISTELQQLTQRVN